MAERRTVTALELCACAIAALGIGLAWSGDAAARTSHGGKPRAAFLADVRSFVVTSRTSGRAYQISVALPDGYSPRHSPYPVLYASDANAEFGTVVETARLLAFGRAIPGVVVVGVGYPNPGQGFRASNVSRTFDLTPTADPDWIRTEGPAGMPQPVPAPDRSGGAPQFLAFLRTQLVPLIERRYNVSHEDRAFAGHSLGGLFGTYALLEGGGLFHRFVIMSPSLWWDHYAVLKLEDAYAASGKPMAARVFFSTGALEDGTGGHPMTSDARSFADKLAGRSYRDLELKSQVFEGEDHGSAMFGALSRGLRFVYGKSAAN
jgi:uncharacterized protein